MDLFPLYVLLSLFFMWKFIISHWQCDFKLIYFISRMSFENFMPYASRTFKKLFRIFPKKTTKLLQQDFFTDPYVINQEKYSTKWNTQIFIWRISQLFSHFHKTQCFKFSYLSSKVVIAKAQCFRVINCTCLE